MDLTKLILSFKSENKQTEQLWQLNNWNPKLRLQYHATMLPLQVTGKYTYILANTLAKKKNVCMGDYLDGI